MSLKDTVYCAICNQPMPFSQKDYKQLAEQMGKSLHEVNSMKNFICRDCILTDTYKTNYFDKVPHIALNIKPE